LEVEKFFLADPPPGKGDNFLLTADRTANRRGLQEVELPVQASDLKALSGLDLLLIFGHYLASGTSPADLKNALDKVGTKALFASHKSGLDGLVDFVIPVPVIAEKSGSLTNIDGRVQPFAAGLGFDGEGLPEWKALLDLAKELKVEPKYFSALASPESVYRALGKEILFFR
jgi:NADH dehydrogenase/NADH:ubiquinone oxidoreductase subunit G